MPEPGRDTKQHSPSSRITFALEVLAVFIGAFAIMWIGNLFADQYLGAYALLFTAATVAMIIAILWMRMRRRSARAKMLKDEFITIAAHRLRTPMTRIQWSSSSLEPEIDSPQGKEFISTIQNATKELIDIVNHLLDAAEAGKGSLYYDYLFEEGHLGTLTQRVIGDYAAGVREKDLTLSVDIEPGLPPVVMDRERLRAAAGALLENAILYTSTGGSIRVRVYKDGDAVAFSVDDEGIGISEEALPHVFAKFYRAKEAVSLDRDRAGLGLSIAKEAIERHGGRLNVTSAGKDQGTHAEFALPAAS